jgi:hypothetical protein
MTARANIVFILIFIGLVVQAQEEFRIFGVQGGYSMSTQNFESFSNRSPIFKPHVDFIHERYKLSSGFGFYSSIGFHTRGSAQRTNFVNLNSGNRENFTTEMRINNLSLNFGVKKRGIKPSGNALYYLLAGRVEAVLSKDFDIYQGLEDEVFPIVAGVTLGFGYEWIVSSSGTIIFGFSIQPDFTNQIDLQPGTYNTTTGDPIQFNRERIRNLSFELSLGYLLYKKRY